MISLMMSVVALSSSGGLLSERAPAAGLLLGAVNLNVAAGAYESMSVTELTFERSRLTETMPSLGGGIALTSIGGGVLLVGLLIAGATFETGVIVAGLIVMGLAVPLLIIGPILLFGALRERREVQAQVRLVDQRLAQLKRDEFAPSPQNNGPLEVPPPPPMRPPGSWLAPTVEPQLQLATF